ncbi:MAG TPA: putative Ig domain-containing protein [Thermoanaerobaculia bacterium]|nr:putative Ig domain-containing protein [Thermoanaerobaculia bacterium]
MRKVILGIIVLLAASAICGTAEAQCLLTTETESLPGFFIGQPANFDIQVCCGTAPYHFEIIEGEMPEGLHLNANGKITGKPRVEADQNVLVLISDAAGCTLGVTYPVRVMVPEP